MEKIIVFGDKFLDIKTMKRPDIMITAIHIDSLNHIVTFITNMGSEGQIINLSVEQCEEDGILDLSKLNKYYK